MFFGGFSGGIAFYPDKVEDTSYIPPIVLTDFQLSGNSVEIGPQSLLTRLPRFLGSEALFSIVYDLFRHYVC
jgi:hypothetical protein